MSHWIHENTIRYAVLKAVESNPGLSWSELKLLIPRKNVAYWLFILAKEKKLIRAKVKRAPNYYSGIWVYFIASNMENAA